MERCIFCQMVSGKAQFYSIHEDTDTLAFLDSNPSAPGHSLVMLKKHGVSILDYSEEDLKKLMKSVQIVDNKPKKSLEKIAKIIKNA